MRHIKFGLQMEFASYNRSLIEVDDEKGTHCWCGK